MPRRTYISLHDGSAAVRALAVRLLGYWSEPLKAYAKMKFWTEDPKLAPYAGAMDTIYYDGFSGPITPASSAVIANYTVVDMFASVVDRQRDARGSGQGRRATGRAVLQKLIRSRRSARQGVGRFTSLPQPSHYLPAEGHQGLTASAELREVPSMTISITRRDSLILGAAALGTRSALAQDAPDTDVPMADVKPPEFQIEKGAELRTIRPAKFVDPDSVWWDRNTKKFTDQTGIPVSVNYISWEDLRPQTAVIANTGGGVDLIFGWASIRSCTKRSWCR